MELSRPGPVRQDNTLLIVDDDRAFLRGSRAPWRPAVSRSRPRRQWQDGLAPFAAARRPLPWSTCVSTTATAST